MNLTPTHELWPNQPSESREPEFQRKIRDYLMTLPYRQANVHRIAAKAFPKKWAKRSAKGGLTARIGDAVSSIPDAHWIPPRNQHEPGDILIIPSKKQ